MMSTINRMDFIENLMSFFRRNTTLKNACNTSPVQLTIDYRKGLGPSDNLSGDDFLIRELAMGKIS
jgi:hypothetical protein